MAEVFKIKNVSGSDIELKEFGVIIVPNEVLELGIYDKSILSEELSGYLLSGQLQRIISDVSVSYDWAYARQSSKVFNDVSVGGDNWIRGKIHIDPSNKLSTAINGDLWVEPSTFNLIYKHPILTSDASSYDLTNRLLRTSNDYVNFSDSSTFTGSDYILIEQAADGYAKRRITANAFATSVTGGFGQFAKYDTSLSISSTNSTAYQNKLVMVTDASAIATTYRVGWSFMLTNSNNSKQSKFKIYVDTSTVANILDEDTVDFDTGGFYNQIAGFRHIALSAGAHTIYIQYAAVTNTARIKNVRAEFWRASYVGV
jgi:hypothetical protein